MNEGENLPATVDETDAALAEVGIGSPAYWRDQGRQDRALQLIRHKEGLEAARQPEEAPENPIALISEAEFLAACPGGDYRVYLGVMREVADVWLAVPEDDQPAFLAGFQALPDGCVAAIVAELQDRSFVASDPELAIEIGQASAKAIERMTRAGGNMSEADFARFEAWVGGLEPGALEAINRKLAAEGASWRTR